MPFVQKTVDNIRRRILISGGPNTGKTTSLATFIEEDQKGVILSCPGEKGTASLPSDKENITPYIYEVDYEEMSENVLFAHKAIQEFMTLTFDILTYKYGVCDVLCIDGIHKLYNFWMDDLSDGAFLRGEDIVDSKGADAGGRLYGKAHNLFGQYLSRIYHSKIPLIIVTVWEEWENRDENLTPQQRRNAVKHLYPALPGKMAKGVIGEFDACISARLERRCVHKGCEYTTKDEDHYVWQIMPKNDVRGVGLKGVIKLPQAVINTPYIHQDWSILKRLLG